MKVSTIREQGNKILASLDEPADPIEGALWLDLNDSNTHPLVNSGSLVEKKIITIDCSSVTFTGLNSLVDGDYYLEFDIVNNLGAGNDIRVSVNGNTTSTNYWRWYRWNNGNSYSSNVQASTNDNITGIWVNTGNGCTGTVRFSIVKGKFTVDVHCILYDSTNHASMQDGVVWSTFDITSINTLLLSADTSVIGSGSVFRLFKSNVAQQLIPYNPINITSRTSDYFLRPGEVAYKTYTNVTNLALGISTVEGEYEVTIAQPVNWSAANTNYIYFNPNHSSATKHVAAIRKVSGTSVTGVGGTGLIRCYFGSAALMKADLKISILAGGQGSMNSNSICQDTSVRMGYTAHYWLTADASSWDSLGTIVFPFAQSGRVIIRRIL